MSEKTFKSPNFYEREIDLSAPTTTGPAGVPGAVIGTSKKGPAFVPVTVADFNGFTDVFGGLSIDSPGTYAANEFLKNKTALTYLKVLGAGSNSTTGDIAETQQYGTVLNAGFVLSGSSVAGPGRDMGCVQFLAAEHEAMTNEALHFPLLSDNSSIGDPAKANLIRGVVLMASGASLRVMASGAPVSTDTDEAAVSATGLFKLVISSSTPSFAMTDGKAGLKAYNVSLDPSSQNYFGKLLNRDPDKFVQEQHMLYLDMALDGEIASTVGKKVGILSGSSLPAANGAYLRDAYGAFNTRYKSPSTTHFISQPFGKTEYDLFKVEALDDGAYANSLYKISITNLRASTDPTTMYGLFNVQVRDFNDNDMDPRILEQFTDCSLNPNSSNYIGKKIGDRKSFYNFDATERAERRMISTGKYPNQSKYVRVVVSSEVENMQVPATALPFGFRGLKAIKTTNSLKDSVPDGLSRLGMTLATANGLSASIAPPVPFRTKVTKGSAANAPASWLGSPGVAELTSPQLYWGVKFERTTDPLNPNTTSEKNPLIESLTKFQGIEKLDVLVTGSGADSFNDNKFTLSRVALAATSVGELTGTINDQMRSAFYIRNAQPDSSTYAVNGYNLSNRLTFASLLNQLDAVTFNQYSSFTKFTNIMGGGFDGINFLDAKARKFNDRSTSFDDGASATYFPPGLVTSVPQAGSTTENNAVNSFITAVDIMTDPMVVNHNLLAIPGIKESYITDYASDKIKDYGMSMYVMDISSYDDDGNELFEDQKIIPSISVTAGNFDARSTDNSYVATYFPDVYVYDDVNRRSVKVPASVAALGALGFNDKVSYPWFAPAGFNRASLDFVRNVSVRLNTADRDRLYTSKVNPIATFPRQGFVIYGQKTLQASKSALDRVNVRRLLLEVKRVIADIAKNLVFEQNTPIIRNNFVAEASQRLALIQQQSGVEKFQVIMNETNNTQNDIDLNRLNGKIIIVPTRVIEFIAIDFIVTNSGVVFV
jgi:hypothetical protein